MPGENKICWSCKGPAAETIFCKTCGVIQPPSRQKSHFDLFDLPKQYPVDRAALEECYRALQQQLHPDRFATRSATERRLSLEHVTQLNEAQRTLLNPLERAAYLLKLEGRDPGGESQGAAPMDPMFLMETMEQREALEEIDQQADDALDKLDAMRQEVESQMDQAYDTIETAFLEYYAQNHENALDQVSQYLDRLRYHRRFLEQLEVVEEKILG
ncbi:Fe-S protein assembly co-chaperone HscB [Magnetococcales bacterium HHB-1]